MSIIINNNVSLADKESHVMIHDREHRVSVVEENCDLPGLGLSKVISYRDDDEEAATEEAEEEEYSTDYTFIPSKRKQANSIPFYTTPTHIMTQNIQALKEEASGKLSSIPSLSNLYNSTSQSGSSTTLNTSHSGILNNGGTGIVQKGTIAHINNHQKITNPYGSATSMSNMSTHSNNTTNTNNSGSNLRHNHDDDEEEDSAFELNWKPQISSDNHTSGYYDKVE